MEKSLNGIKVVGGIILMVSTYFFIYGILPAEIHIKNPDGTITVIKDQVESDEEDAELALKADNLRQQIANLDYQKSVLEAELAKVEARIDAKAQAVADPGNPKPVIVPTK